MAIMGSKYVIISVILFATVACAHKFVCPLDTCALAKCDEITASSCEDKGQVLMPYAGFCGCCPACVKKINKGERCPGFLQILDEPERAGCETGTMCKEIADETFVCD